MDNPLLGMVIPFAGNFAPRGWALCEGQLLAVSSNSALFSILGTIYGGDGRTTFALPDLRGRIALQHGTGPGLTNKRLGQKGGATTVTLTINELPSHTHNVAPQASANDADTADATNNGYGASENFGPTGGTEFNMAPVKGDAVGGSREHENMAPFLALNYIIALQGTYPSRS